MKTTVIVDFDTYSVWTLVESEYRFDFDATQDALNLMHDLRLKCAGDAGIGWQLLYNAMGRLEKDCQAYFASKC